LKRTVLEDYAASGESANSLDSLIPCKLRQHRPLAATTCTEGSNSLRSATQPGPQRNLSAVQAESSQKSRQFAVFSSRTAPAENGLSGPTSPETIHYSLIEIGSPVSSALNPVGHHFDSVLIHALNAVGFALPKVNAQQNETSGQNSSPVHPLERVVGRDRGADASQFKALLCGAKADFILPWPIRDSAEQGKALRRLGRYNPWRMKKLVWLSLFAVVISITLVGCNNPQPIKQVTQRVQTEQASTLEDPSQPRLATLSQQKMCDEQAEKQFKIYGTPAKGDTANEYVSHYDARANVCYMMIHRGGISYGNPTVSNVVSDAFEGRVYANYIWINSGKKKYWEVAPMECDVKPRGQPEIKCKSSDEFDALIDKYFGIGR
jgi:hypothetical protein